jgi:hypothetical protein
MNGPSLSTKHRLPNCDAKLRADEVSSPNRRILSTMRPVPRRGLSRDEAAMYVGVSAGKFDEMVGDGRMPRPVKIDRRNIWDIRSLDLAFDELSAESPSQLNSWKGV